MDRLGPGHCLILMPTASFDTGSPGQGLSIYTGQLGSQPFLYSEVGEVVSSVQTNVSTLFLGTKT